MGSQILLIDDDVDLLESYEEDLQLSGYDVLVASTPKYGLELYSKHSPCIVFLDVRMPEMDGYELFSKIKELDPLAKVVIVTGHGNEKKLILAQNNGLLDVLKKPVNPKQLNDTIKKNNC